MSRRFLPARILDRYLASQFLRYLLLALIAFVLVYAVVDLFEKLDRFIDRQVGPLEIAFFYLLQVPYITVLVVPVAVLLSSFFSVGQLVRHNELIAMKCSGISLYRILAPLLVLGFGTSIVVLCLDELVVPGANRRKASFERQAIEGRPPIDYSRRKNIYYYGMGGRMYYIGSFDGNRQMIRDVVIHEYTRAGAMARRIDARAAVWSNGRWTFRDGFLRTFDEQGTELPDSSYPFSTLVIPELQETPDDFAKREEDPAEMNFWELRHYISKLRGGGADVHKELVELKTAFPFANLIILLVGAPLSSNMRHSGFALGFGASLFVCFFYWGFIQTGRALGHNGTISPFIAAWMPNILFGAAGIVLLLKVKK
jgi:lipopolysaccharide export system permease protein